MSDGIQRTTCCIVGAGPGGVMAAYLLAEQGVDVLLLEAHHDFDRDFRGDTIHAGIMELLDQMGLADDLLQLPHAKMESMSLTVNGRRQRIIDFADTDSHFPYVTMMPQSQFLNFLVKRAQRFESCNLRLGARVTEVIEAGEGYAVQYTDNGVHQTIEADLIIAADGRHSSVRKLLNLKPKKTAVPMDVLWFRIPRRHDDGIAAGGYVGNGHLLVLLERTEAWQVGFVFLHGTFRDIKSYGIDWVKNKVGAILPAAGTGMQEISDWKDLAVLNVESSRLKTWHHRNVLFIGDAAHVMSPVGGVGINYAIQDAIVAAGIVGPPLLQKSLTESHLAKVQQKRIWPTRLIQRFQALLQKRVVQAALDETSEFQTPWLLRFRFIRRFVARFIAYGFFRVELPKTSGPRSH